MAAHPLNRVVVIPLWLAPWVLTVIVMDIFSGLAANALIEQLMDRLTEEMGLVAGPLAACTFIAILAYGPVAVPIVGRGAASHTTHNTNTQHRYWPSAPGTPPSAARSSSSTASR